MSYAQGLDPSLLTQRQPDEEPEFDKLRDREVPMKLSPQRVVRDLGVPEDRARVGEGNLLPLSERVGGREIQKLIVLRFRDTLPSRLDGPLNASVLAFYRLGDINATEFLEAVIENAMPEC